MARLWGGAVGPFYEPSLLFPDLDEYELRELARASRELLERGKPERRPRSRWERQLTPDGEYVDVEVERLPPLIGEDDGT